MMLRPYGVRNRYTLPSLYVTGNVTVVGGVMALHLAATGFVMQALSASANIVLPSGYGTYVPDTYEIPAAYTVEIEAGATLEIGG